MVDMTPSLNEKSSPTRAAVTAASDSADHTGMRSTLDSFVSSPDEAPVD
jgi:hypothetical protein